MPVPRSLAPAVLLVVAMVVVPLAGVGLANAVRPVIPEGAAAAVDPTPPVPAIPQPPTTVRPLSAWFERLPIVDPGSAAKARPFLARYRALPVGDVAAAAALIDVAVTELSVAPAARTVVRQLRDALVRPADDTGEPDGFGDGTDAPVVGPFDTPAFQALAKRAMTAIATTPSNAAALNDVAVAIATTALASPSLLPASPDEGPPIASSSQLRDAATHLLLLGLASFPADRSMTVNLAYLRSIEGGSDDGAEADEAAADLLQASDPALAALEAFAQRAPTDVTARALLANLMIRTDVAHGLDRAIALAKPPVDDPTTEPAGRTIRADSLMFAADRLQAASPFTARSTVRQALDDYDRVIELTGDAAAYVGRARALDLLGSREAALEAQREAVRLTPASVAWRLRLAQLEGCTGQVAAWRRDAQGALAAATAATTVPAIATRYVLADAPGRNYGRYSIGSDRPTWDVTLRIPATGAIIVAIDPFPEPPACMTAEPSTLTAVDDATLEAALAAMADDDLAGARTAVTASRVPLSPTDDGEEAGADATWSDTLLTILDLLDGKPLPDEDTSLGTFVPLASRLPPDVQGRICRKLSGVVGLTPEDWDALTVCQAEAVDRSGDHAAAARAIQPAVRLDDRADPMAGPTALKAGMLSELTEQLDTARVRYEAAATYGDTAIGGLLRLGDLDLRDGDATGALDHYALAAAAIRTQSARADGIVLADTLAGRLRQYLDNNRGIALLMSARSGPDSGPDCAAHAAICEAAGDAFAAATTADPMNPVYPMNAAWVARLTGDPDRAEALLTEAMTKGTPLRAAAENDLGVIAAQRGDVDGARAHLHRAIATQPDYDLAIWNLGVLEAREAGPLLVAGQALLAQATGLNPDLLTHEVAFQPDDRVYRIEVSGTQLEVARAPGTGAAIGAAAFGAIATVGAIGQLLSNIGSDVQGAAGTMATESLGRAGRRFRGLRGLGGRRGSGADGGRSWPSWLAWVPAIVVMTVTTAWTAAWMAPDAFATAVLIGLVAAGLALVVHTCGHLVVAGRFGARLRPSHWTPGIALAVVGMPFHVPAGPFLAEHIETGDPGRDWWVSVSGVLANLAAAGVAFAIYLAAPMPFLRILVATQLAVAAFALIPSDPLDGARLSTRPIVLALLALGIAAASAAIAVGAI